MVIQICQRMTSGDKANVPTKQSPEEAQARFSRSHEDARGSGNPQGAPGQGPGETVGLARPLVVRIRSLSSEQDFTRVVRRGRATRRDGITVFVDSDAPKGAPGVGLSVRVRGSAVRRNRARRRVRAALLECRVPSRDIVIRADDTVVDMEFQKLVSLVQRALEDAEAGW
jgi:ribonuclease P protein component